MFAILFSPSEGEVLHMSCGKKGSCLLCHCKFWEVCMYGCRCIAKMYGSHEISWEKLAIFFEADSRESMIYISGPCHHFKRTFFNERKKLHKNFHISLSSNVFHHHEKVCQKAVVSGTLQSWEAEVLLMAACLAVTQMCSNLTHHWMPTDICLLLHSNANSRQHLSSTLEHTSCHQIARQLGKSFERLFLHAALSNSYPA